MNRVELTFSGTRGMNLLSDLIEDLKKNLNSLQEWSKKPDWTQGCGVVIHLEPGIKVRIEGEIQ